MHRTRLLMLLALIALLIPAGLGAMGTAHAAGPTIVISPSGIPVGTTTTVTVIGAGFTPNNTVTLKLDNNTLSQPIATSATGAFSQAIPVDASASSAGAHVLSATDNVTHATVAQTLYVVKLGLSATSGAAGAQVTLSGQGFPPNTAIAASIGSQTIVSGVTTDSFGNFSKAFTVPALAGSQQIVVQVAQSSTSAPFSATIGFSITGATSAAAIALNPTTVHAGGTFAITGAGFPANTALTVKIDATALATSLISSGSGSFGATALTVPTTIGIGEHNVTVSLTSNQNQPLASAVLTVTSAANGATITLNPTTAAAGGTFTVTGAGFPANAQLTVMIDATPLTYTLYSTGSGTFAATTFTVPTGLTAGPHTVSVALTSNQSQPLARATLTVGSGTAGRTITLTPTTISAGGTFTLTGAGFPDNTELTVKIGTVALTTALATNAAGAFTASFKAPTNLTAGTHLVTVATTSNQGQVLASAVLTVGASGAVALTATPTTVQAGSQVTLNGSGFGANELITLTATGLTIPNIQASAAGAFSATLAIPATESAATLPITAIGQQTHRTATVTLTIQRSSAAISLSAGTVQTGGSVQVTGAGFTAGEQVVIAIAGRTVATINANSQGAFSGVAASVPAGISGAVTVTATGQSSHRAASATLTVTAPVAASISVTPSSFAAGAGIHITGTGFAPGEKISLSLGSGVTFATAIAGSHGGFAITLALPGNLPVGSQRITATGLDSHISASATVQVTSSTPTPPGPNPGPITAGSTTWYFAAGRTDNGFSEQFAVLNPNNSGVQGTITLFYGSNQTRVQSFTLGAHARGTYDVGQLIGQQAVVAAIVQANLPVAAARTTRRGNQDIMSTAGVPAPGKTWYFAEGYTGLTFQESLDLLNPGSAAAHVRVTWPLFNGRPPVTYSVTMAPRTAMSIPVNQYVIKASHATIVNADQPVVASRTILFGTSHQGADSKAGATQAYTTLLFAEGSTNNGFQEYLTILNPSTTQQSQVTADFYDRQGHLLGTKVIVVDPMHRGNIKVNDITRNTAIATILRSTVPIVAERTMYFGAPNGGSAGGTVVFGTNTPRDGWAFATGDTRPGHSEFELLFNPGSTSSTIQAIYYADNGQVVQQTFTLPANTRMNIDVTRSVPGLARGYHGVILRTLNGVPFVAEQALYTSNGVRSIGFGSAMVGTPLS